MTLIEAIRDLDSLDEESTIYASEPWTEDSAAIVASEDSEELPVGDHQLGLKYFLEVFIAREFLEGWVENLGAEPTLQEKCMRLIQYATNDA